MKQKSCTLIIANQKGGVGKTTTATTLASGLADESMGYFVTLVDCDPQGNCASFFGHPAEDGLYRLLIGKLKADQVTTPIGPALDLVAGDATTVDADTLIRTSTRINPKRIIYDAIQPYLTRPTGSKANLVILDTAPSLSSIQVSALYASDWLIVPASPEYASEIGINALVQTVNELKEAGATLKLLGILPTMVDVRSSEHREIIKELEEQFPGLVLPSIRRRIAIAEAPGRGQTIWQYNKEASYDYTLLLAEVIRRIGL
jgi:chromosome partitioning protein